MRDVIGSLPHWARVAFAARCARSVMPLLSRAWPEVPPERLARLAGTIDLAERSAAEGHALDGLVSAAADATMVAGAALMGTGPFRNDERAPTDETRASTASLSAKPAEFAAKAAASDPGLSAEPAADAYHFARDAINVAGAEPLLDILDDDLAALVHVAKRGGWTDRDPVPPTVFDLLSREGSRRRRWRFW